MNGSHLLEERDGQYYISEVQVVEKRRLHPDLLHPLVTINEDMKFTLYDRVFTYHMYASEGLLTYVIEMPVLPWQVPIQWDADDGIIRASSNTKDNKSILLENLVLIVHTGDKARSMQNVYISTRDKRAPIFSNIFHDGRVCIEHIFKPGDHPSNMVAYIEDTPGTNHLCRNPHTGGDDDKAELDIYLKNGEVYGIPAVKEDLNHEQQKYLAHIQ